MPLPSDETTPPVTKMYFVELTDSPPSDAGSTALPRTADRPPCPRRAPPGRRTPPRRSARRAATAAAAPVAPTAPRERAAAAPSARIGRHTSELQSRFDLVCRLLLEKKKKEYIVALC